MPGHLQYLSPILLDSVRTVPVLDEKAMPLIPVDRSALDHLSAFQHDPHFLE